MQEKLRKNSKAASEKGKSWEEKKFWWSIEHHCVKEFSVLLFRHFYKSSMKVKTLK
jgi:hypothetical protein